jgi:uncharacterized protein (TIGR03382 family)
VPRNFTVQGNVVDSDIKLVELYVDGTRVGSMAGGTYAFPVTDQPEGEHELELVATDMGDQTTSQVITVVVARGTGQGDGTPDGGEPGDPLGGGEAPYLVGGCSAGGTGAGAALPLLGLAGLGLVRRRRRG